MRCAANWSLPVANHQDATAMLLAGVDAPRELPARLRMRLEDAVVANVVAPEPENLAWMTGGPRRLPAGMRARLEASLSMQDADASDSDIVSMMAGVDAPRPVPAAMATRLEAGLMSRRAARIYQIMGAAAVAVAIVAGSVFLGSNGLGNGTRAPGGTTDALPTIQTSPAPTTPPSGTTRVLGAKIRTPLAPSQDHPGVGNPQIATVVFAPTATSSGGASAPAPTGSLISGNTAGNAETLSVLSSVTAIIDQALRALGIEPGRAGSVRSLPADDSAMVSSPAAPQSSAPAPRSRTLSGTGRTHTASAHRSAGSTRASHGSSKSSTLTLHSILGGASTHTTVTLNLSAAGLSVSL